MLAAAIRATIEAADDSKKLQEVRVLGGYGERIDGVEHLLPFGFTAVPLPPGEDMQAETFVLFLGDNRSHPVAIATVDRRYRPKNLKPGEVAAHDDQGQVHAIKRDGIVSLAKSHSITAGNEPEAGEHELQSQLKGFGARIAQLEAHVSGLHYEASRIVEIAIGRVPELSALTSILNKMPSGLDAMSADVQGLAQNYLQKQVQQALDKFVNPNLSGLASVLPAGVEAGIAALQAEIANLLVANPVVAAVDALQAELAALTSSGAEAAVVQAGTARLQAQITALIGDNPVVNTVANLRAQLANAVTAAGPGLNFLGPLQRVVQGVTRSMKLTGG